MRKRYIILAAILIILGAGTMLMPDKENSDQVAAEKLLQELNDQTRNKAPIFVAQMIIEKDPSFQIIDVRPPEEYQKFTLPGAINIPLEEMNNPEYQGYLDPIARNNIFISNGGLKANQAWMLCLRKGFQKNYVMEGGLNRWMETIMRPVPPPATAPKIAFEEYDKCKAASLYFGGGSMDINTDIERKELPMQRRKKERAVVGGC
ncbi:MAG TPA: rhodanese-like domain-containing protein [Prolixibacteraceae bacterium]|nr:rhodanese-like domain-containing protein [Prolixibacteraceae bacterium]